MSVTEKTIDHIGQFYSHDHLPDKTLFGYEEQMKAGLALGLTVARGAYKTALVFGYPGTGKGAFPLVLAVELNKRLRNKFSFFKIHCERVLIELRAPQELSQTLSHLSGKIEQNRPIIVAFDELETVSYTKRRLSLSSIVLYKWLVSFITQHIGEVLVIGITSYPQEVDKALAARFCVPLYFDVTSPKMITEIIKYHLGAPRYETIAEILTDQLRPLGLSPISSEIINACSELKELDFETLSDDEIVNSIRRNLTPHSSIESIKKYRNDNARLIELSEKYSIPHWSRRFEKEQTLLAST